MEQNTQVKIKGLYGSLDTLYVDIGRYSTDDEGLKLLYSNISDLDRWNGPYVHSQGITDEQGNEFLYKYDNLSKKHIVYSSGVNGIDENGKGDDILCGSFCENSKIKGKP